MKALCKAAFPFPARVACGGVTSANSTSTWDKNSRSRAAQAVPQTPTPASHYSAPLEKILPHFSCSESHPPSRATLWSQHPHHCPINPGQERDPEGSDQPHKGKGDTEQNNPTATHKPLQSLHDSELWAASGGTLSEKPWLCAVRGWGGRKTWG